MLEVKKGMVINMDDKKSGTNTKGPWCLVQVKAEKGYDSITVFATNPREAVTYGGEAMIGEIESVTIATKKSETSKTGWMKFYTVNAKIEGKVANAEAKKGAYEDFMDLGGVGEELPFN